MTVYLVFGCSGERQREDGGAAGPAWPLTGEKRSALGKMPRVEREAWLKAFGLPEYEARRLKGTLTIDGVLDEPDWRSAPAVELLGTRRGTKPKLKTTARMLWDDEAMYLAFECDDPDVHAPLDKHDDDLWRHDLVEVFIGTDQSEMHYMELHAAPSNALADVIWADFDPEVDWFTTPGWKYFSVASGKKAFNLPGMTVGVKINGTLNRSDDTDGGYVVEWRIPFAGMRRVVPSLEKSKPHPIDMTQFELTPIEKPVVGTVWRMNFNRNDDSTKMTRKNRARTDVPVIERTAWSPPIRSDHMPMRFGIVRFIDQDK